jgi:hypothetical protein
MRFRFGGIAMLAGVFAIAAAAVVDNREGRAGAGDLPIVSIDTDISDGACADTDSSDTVNPDDVVAVAVCLVNNPSGVNVAAFRFNLLYDDGIIDADGGSNSRPALDTNPDANAGGTTFPYGRVGARCP